MNSNINKNKKSSNSSNSNNSDNSDSNVISVEDFRKLQLKESQLTTELNWNKERLQ